MEARKRSVRGLARETFFRGQIGASPLIGIEIPDMCNTIVGRLEARLD
jgi:hypothetical protein